MHVESVNLNFVAKITKINLQKEIDSVITSTIEKNLDKFAVLIFPNQEINDEQQMEFSRNFGVLERPGNNTNLQKVEESRLHPEMVDVANLVDETKPYSREDKNRLFNLGNRLWHSDSSYKQKPAKYSILSARTFWEEGGETQFADMRAAYDSLDNKLKDKIKNLVCEHSLFFSRQMLGFDMSELLTPHERKNFKPVPQPLVREHPVTGRKSLFLASHIGNIKGWLRPDAMCLIRDLIEHATQPKFVYTHSWSKFDLIVWDNRQTMHRGLAFDDTSLIRDIRRTTIEGHSLL